MKKLTTIILVFFIISTAKSQDALSLVNKTLHKISSCKTLSHFSKQKWGSIADIDDISLHEGQCIFKIAPKDTLIGSHCHFKLIDHSVLYNGKTLAQIDFRDSTAVVSDLKKYPDRKRSVTSQMLYTNSVIHIYNLLKEARDSSPGKIKLLSDTLINGVKCNRILLVHSDTTIASKRLYWHRKISLDPITFLPVHSVSIALSEFGLQIIECLLYDYLINDPLVVEEVFSPNSIPGYIKIKEYNPEAKQKRKVLKINQPAPDWMLPGLKGDTIRLADLKGKAVLLEFSGVHCGFCLLSVPKLNRIYEKFNSSDFSLVSVYSDEQPGKLRKYVARYDIKYTIAYNGEEEKKTQDILKKYCTNGIPNFILINQEGIISKLWDGYQSNIEEEITAEIEKLVSSNK